MERLRRSRLRRPLAGPAVRSLGAQCRYGRAEAVRADPGTATEDGSAENASAENAGARALSGARFAKPDPADAAVREELRAQEAAIRRNAARAEALASR